jgi:hypothetical protein
MPGWEDYTIIGQTMPNVGDRLVAKCFEYADEVSGFTGGRKYQEQLCSYNIFEKLKCRV